VKGARDLTPNPLGRGIGFGEIAFYAGGGLDREGGGILNRAVALLVDPHLDPLPNRERGRAERDNRRRVCGGRET
jgi:hypothetical protein